MPNVRTTCPRCDIVTVEAPEITVRHLPAPARSQAVFVCPACAGQVVHPLNDRMIPVLIGAGCPVEHRRREASALVADGPEITEDEIAHFVRSLDRADWFDALDH